MKKIMTLAVLVLSVTSNAQRTNRDFDRRYFYHWQSTNPTQFDMEIIIHKESGKTRVSEFKNDHTSKLGGGVLYSTVYICINKKGRMVVETLDPSTMQLNNSEYILTPHNELLRVTQKDTITFKRRY